MQKKGIQLQVYLVDDHPLMRESLAGLLNQEFNLAVCGEADNASFAHRDILKKKPDLVILDISLNGSSGFDIISLLKSELPQTKIIVLSMHDEKLFAERCIRSGANGYVMKRESSKRILGAIQEVMAGKMAISDNVSRVFLEKFIDGRKSNNGTLLSELSDRELEVFNLLGQGLSSRKIAEALKINIKTVQIYTQRIKQKLHFATATELLHEATRWYLDSSKF
jgi:DNA-binding NarL/FixJ family response regulator